ncbi:MAG TPA: CBS domain-containing protein [Streptosporangiaceae bacterium]|jgi:CBS domain-containing protein|nr:CBS domain-containing protein [Streptosporangiaceae bacterium]
MVSSPSPRRLMAPAADALRRRNSRLTTRRAVQQAIISVASLVGSPVFNQRGQRVGKLVDLVARMHGQDRYPPLTGLLVRIGSRNSFLPIEGVENIAHQSVYLRTARLDLREFTRRPGEVLLAKDMLDHQVVDLDGRQVIRAADLYLAPVAGQFVLVGLDVSLNTLLRRLGPKRFSGRPTPERVIDWDAVAPFSDDLTSSPPAVQLRASDEQLRRMAPADLADLLEDLGRPARQDLLSRLENATAADALEEMDPDELEALLREVRPEQAAALVAAMEPDEAVDALRDLSDDERGVILGNMEAIKAGELSGLLSYPEREAGGFMTTTLVHARPDSTIGEVKRAVAALGQHREEIDAVVVCSEDGGLVADLPLFDLVTHADDALVSDVLAADGQPETLTVPPDASVADVADQLVRTRHSSLLVVTEHGRPLGRILADDVLDAMLPERGRLHFPRLLQ